MAYLDPETLTCPQCEKRAELVWVVGVGPNTKPGEGPDYVDILESGPWLIETVSTSKEWYGVIKCPDCGAVVRRAP